MNNYNKYIAESLGTLFLVFIGAGAVCANYSMKVAGAQGTGYASAILVFGIVVIAVVYATNYISGSHINPVVTISFLVTGRIGAGTAGFYIISQLLGAVIAGFFLRILFPDAVSTVHLGTCVLGKSVEFWKALLIEAVMSFLFVFTIFTTALGGRRAPGKIIAGVAIGLVYLFGALVASSISGGALNPARVFGPAVASGHFDYHFVWWLGPMSGGIGAVFLHDKIFSGKSAENKDMNSPRTNSAEGE
jgi:glycerol uptake facilitator protein